ncbi:glycosyl hydrolase [Paradesertivirga mongoliensis]|uniref:Glycosyl hydrolase n=1 Tax=Paradesertivirga mongoliensis TaxID=2100740 RepID=A0ABW4ZKB1_9SPHI|nr:glycosyl hydrolase [Pedobacter mongoliensis]
MTRNNLLTSFGLLIFLLIFCAAAYSQNTIESLKANFKTPPQTGWPRTWWHWSHSNVTKEGITKDLEWMKRAGIAGMQLGDVAYGSGQTVTEKIVFRTPEWLDAVRHTAAEADRLGLEMSMFTSAGWSLTGGPWVKPEQAMKKLVWSEVRVEGSKTFKGKLPQPPANEGAGPNLSPLTEQTTPKGFYKDFAVIAYRTPANELISATPAKVSSSSGEIDKTQLFDSNLATSGTIKAIGQPRKAWLLLDFNKPVTATGITIAGKKGIPFGSIMASNDGISFSTLTNIPGKTGYRGGRIRTYDFAETKARYYKVEMTNAPARPGEIISQITTLADSVYDISEIQIHTGGRVNRWEDKAGFNFLFEYAGTETPALSPGSVIASADVIDLSSKMSADGTLNWDPPKGNWTIMRFGYALTGAKNRPAVPAGLGYEVDKLSKKHAEAYMQEYTNPIKGALGNLYGKSLQYMVMDSWEAGIQNWTEDMPAEFKKRRGYDMTPYLPVLAGRVYKNSEISDRFLWDFRRTLVDMFAENHYGTVTDFLNKQGIKTYSEAGGVSLESMEDALLNKKYVDIPMGEFWVRDLHPSSMYYEDVRGAASASHVYGKNLVAAEAFTGGNYESPYTLKKLADYWFTQGINRLVFHTSAHQPLDTKPGNTMVGTHINRNITWAEQARPFMTYLSRASYMLQQGTYVADVAYLLNEGAPSTMPFWGAGLQPALPDGYSFDYINADVLLNRIKFEGGRLTLPDGLNYGVLVLPQTTEMTLPVLKKIRELVGAGATVLGPKPVKTPGLIGYPASDDELKELAGEVWGDLDGISRTVKTYGKGKVLWGMPLQSALNMAGITRDIDANTFSDGLSWIHRKTPDADIYFIVNRKDSPQHLDINFRVSGKHAEIFNPDKGTYASADYTASGERTMVDLQLEERESVFVVFHGVAQVNDNKKVSQYESLATIDGPWTVSFPPNWGAPEKIEMTNLSSWTNHSIEGVKYFSGTANYNKTFELNKKSIQNAEELWIDLGDVKDIAEVSLNGKIIDTLWKAPFRADISKAIKPGKNQLQIRVTNQWTNRLIGDQATTPEKRILASYTAPFGGRYVLAPSGLLGPVRILSSAHK